MDTKMSCLLERELPGRRPEKIHVMTAFPKQAPTHVSIAVLDANPILGEAMCRHFSSVKQFGRDEMISLTWDRVNELAMIRPSILVLDPAQELGRVRELISELRVAVPDLLLVGYASDASSELARLCLGLGFRAFVPKSADSGQLVTALSVVASGGIYVDRQFVDSLLPATTAASSRGALSQREEAILKRLAMGLSHKQIAAELGMSHKTVDTYRARGMRKLELVDRGALVRYALKQGWLE